MLRVAIVGCGKIADAHASQIQRVKNCEIVGVCDREALMARQLYERFPVADYFSDLLELLTHTRPDVVHVTTSPESHFEVAALCLQHGCHVLVEKPFTLREHEAQKLIALANNKGLKITAGHDDQFRHAARRMRTLVQNGFLGSRPVHLESHYCYEIGRSGYAGSFLGDKQHWIRRLPGQLLQNIISHGIARIAEYLVGESPEVMAYGFVSPRLAALGENEIIDELRVLVCDEKRTTAYFTFSSQMRPSIHEFRIYGAENGLVLDQDHETLIKLRGTKLKSYLDQMVPPITIAGQYLGNVMTNARTFLASEFHMKAGLKYLIDKFYECIRDGGPPPIPYREILLTSRIMDSIFEQLDAGKKARSPVSIAKRARFVS